MTTSSMATDIIFSPDSESTSTGVMKSSVPSCLR